MRWRDSRASENVEDYRGKRPPRGGGMGMKFGLGTIVLVVIAYLLGIDPRVVMGLAEVGGQIQQRAPQQSAPAGAPSDEMGQFVARVLGETEDTWGEIFRAGGQQYPAPRLVLFTEAAQSACGFASSASGPFYCPADQKVYIDLAFFRQLETEFRAGGDFAMAYVMAHEVGHHVQTVLGISERVRASQQRASQEQANQLQVRMELQADCFAGVWANHANAKRQILEPGDVEEAMRAAAAVGDDVIQKRTQGYVVPESWTHGSAQQRQQWFVRGFESGSLQACDTFGAG
ncbi:MAG TPA: neutral zinc metallopeptidase [Steroidobacteraceae bacterium]|nr:neutral zinc metallopeptidase [Steroidobacteraceae bacterium]